MTRPTVLAFSFASGDAKLGMFGRLNASKRNFSRECSPLWNCFNSEKSNVYSGPVRACAAPFGGAFTVKMISFAFDLSKKKPPANQTGPPAV